MSCRYSPARPFAVLFGLGVLIALVPSSLVAQITPPFLTPMIANVTFTDNGKTVSAFVASPHSAHSSLLLTPTPCIKPCRLHIDLPFAALDRPDITSTSKPGDGRDVRIIDGAGRVVNQILVQWPLGSNVISVDFVAQVTAGNPLLTPAFSVSSMVLVEPLRNRVAFGPAGLSNANITKGYAAFGVSYSGPSPALAPITINRHWTSPPTSRSRNCLLGSRRVLPAGLRQLLKSEREVRLPLPHPRVRSMSGSLSRSILHSSCQGPSILPLIPG